MEITRLVITKCHLCFSCGTIATEAFRFLVEWVLLSGVNVRSIPFLTYFNFSLTFWIPLATEELIHKAWTNISILKPPLVSNRPGRPNQEDASDVIVTKSGVTSGWKSGKSEIWLLFFDLRRWLFWPPTYFAWKKEAVKITCTTFSPFFPDFLRDNRPRRVDRCDPKVRIWFGRCLSHRILQRGVGRSRPADDLPQRPPTGNNTWAYESQSGKPLEQKQDIRNGAYQEAPEDTAGT